LILPDVLTELDLLAPMPDPSLLLAEPLELASSQQDPTLLDWGSSQMLSGSIEQARGSAPEPLQLEEDDLMLDIGEGPTLADISIEMGRHAPPPRSPSIESDTEGLKLYDGDELGLDIGEDPLPSHALSAGPTGDDAMDIEMDGLEQLGAPIEDGAEADAGAPRERETASPLSSIPAAAERDMEETYQDISGLAEDETFVQPLRVKRRKILQQDVATEIQSSQIRAQQNDRSKILKPQSFLPRDPMLLALMNMQKSGGFVSSILGDGRSQGWAPELRGILSIEVIRRAGDRKRKRDNGILDFDADEEEEAAADKVPGLELDTEEGAEPTEEEIPAALAGADDMPTVLDDDDAEDGMSPLPENFDETTIPLLHPAESGPISQGTRHAVYLLRDQFGAAAAESADERQKTSVLFEDLLPQGTTTRSNATKMFFEILVLATKDAVKVEQPADTLGGPIRVRGKRGLWGAWAEEQAGGEIASQEQGATVEAVA